MATEYDAVIEQRHRLAVAAGAALLVAGLVLVMFVLPAEFAVDPLGTGARFGLIDLGITGQQVAALENAAVTGGGAERAVIVIPQERSFQQETVDFMLGPGEGMEYKYRLDQGQALLVLVEGHRARELRISRGTRRRAARLRADLREGGGAP